MSVDFPAPKKPHITVRGTVLPESCSLGGGTLLSRRALWHISSTLQASQSLNVRNIVVVHAVKWIYAARRW